MTSLSLGPRYRARLGPFVHIARCVSAEYPSVKQVLNVKRVRLRLQFRWWEGARREKFSVFQHGNVPLQHLGDDRVQPSHVLSLTSTLSCHVRECH